MNNIEEKFKTNAKMGLFVSISIFIILGTIFLMAVFGIFSGIDSSTGVDTRIKGFTEFFDHPGFNGFTLLVIASIINAGFFILSLFFFIIKRNK